ncbi:MAG TPA: site-specific DNA-methyltransferase [Patescibacteria group bacterium]|nr:site-specific DNA-methyltransferase [Patescibacteria group bacterium]
MKITENEKRDIIKYLEKGKPLPEKYRFLLFDDNREVELLWNGKADEIENTVLPFQTIEHIDEPRSEDKINLQGSLFDTSGRQQAGWANKLIWGDNKLILSSLKNGPLRKQIEAEGGLKLIYIDPPFDVGADFSMKVEIGDEEFTKKPSVIEEVAYRDTWGKGADSFISMIYERLKLMHGLLADDGSIYVHCDWRVAPYIRQVLDEVFGSKNFRRDIIWVMSAASGYKGMVENYVRGHENIIYYSKSENIIFNKPFKEYSESQLRRFTKIDEEGRKYKPITKTRRVYLDESRGVPISDVWDDIANFQTIVNSPEIVGYPTQKPEKLMKRIIETSTNEGDLIADFFCGSGTTLAVAEKLDRKWIGTDLGRFSIHTTRKRMIGVQRGLKKEGKDFRAFEILNLGRYERDHYLQENENLREEERRAQKENKEKQFRSLILQAYKAESVNSFNTFVGKKRDRMVAVGAVDVPITIDFLNNIIEECKEKNITKADILGFDYEMGINFDEAKQYGIDIAFKVIPREVFDRKAVEKGQVKFHDVAYIEVKPIVKGRGKLKEVAIELTDFSVFYNQDNTGETDEKLKSGQNKIIIENGQVVKYTKDKKTDLVEKEVLTKKWTDWIDYWSVDFNFESKKEIIKVIDGEKENEEWTGNYIFENEWQSFRTKKDRSLELTSVFKETPKGKTKIAVKVVDIFGNDTTKVIDINI